MNRMGKRERCKQCNRKMRETDSVIDTISPIDKMYGCIRIFTDFHAIPRARHRFFRCKDCNLIYRI